LVVVTLVPVPFTKVTFWRDVSPRTVNVDVTVEEAAIKPPYNWTVVVAEEPRAETVARVSLFAVPEQFVPSWRHTFFPAIVSVVPDPFVKERVPAKRLVEVEFVVVANVEVRLVVLRVVGLKVVPLNVVMNPRVAWRLVAKRFVLVVLVPVAEVHVRLVGLNVVPEMLVKEAFVANRLVVVTLVPVPFVKVTFWRDVSPRTVNVDVTVEEAAMSPPYNWTVVVAEEPRAVTCANVCGPLPT
jgi:hypothetical protein